MNIALQRLINQRITGQQFDDPAKTVAWMGAMQAQDYGQALWAIGLRTRGSTRSTIEAAIADGKILRTWPMRGTIHFVPAEDAAWMVGLTAPKIIAADGRRMAQLELTDEIIKKSGQILHDALRGKKPLTRPAVLQTLQDAGISTANQRSYHILWRLALAGHICIGPMEGKQQTFVWLDDWAPRQTTLTREEGLAELARRYFQSHGPATLQDFSTWSSQNLTDSKQAVNAIRPELTAFNSENREYLLHKDAAKEVGHAQPLLLPGFDEYILGYKDRRDVLHADHAAKIVPGGNGVFYPMIIADGQVMGTWKRTIKPKVIDVNIQPFVKFSAAMHKQIQTELRHYEEFMNLPVRLI